MSVERRNLLKAYGAELVLTRGAKRHEKGAIRKRAEELKNEIADAIVLGQFVNRKSGCTQSYNRSGNLEADRWGCGYLRTVSVQVERFLVLARI